MSNLQLFFVFVTFVLVGNSVVVMGMNASEKAGQAVPKVNPFLKWGIILVIAVIGTAGIAWLSKF